MNMKNVFAASMIAGLIASSAAMADEHKAAETTTTTTTTEKHDANNCNGKDSCKGHEKKSKKVVTKKHVEEKKAE